MALVPPTVSIAPGAWTLGGQDFDAWLHTVANTSLTITQHPVAQGANITDHSFVNPRRWSFELGKSDVMSGVRAGIDAYGTLVANQMSRTPLILVSKYGSFDNVLIESVDAVDDYRTVNAGRFNVTLREIIIVGTEFSTKTSSNPHATSSTNRGQVSVSQPRHDFVQAAARVLGRIFTKLF